ncbi:hypothetical protein H310_12520 [Aphanomyces invadans]|uniref:Integrase catalytic domain-containing protein n=1 Tax=Aphanomyces invadans TaxID=157072 RepID=A0A024THL6_9STRA|nr:hypothetical protein H310_12520 [Aphanomyces invadans]ETV93469.1 hypothetical protein H310_12520 [Aphanomyces invadans]|eukprot:XP_008877811.1 hypothetical protein H310_12520 [Aphanomyces invadans]
MVGAHHHITTAYSPWANGTVEVVNRLVLRAVKALLNKMRLNVEDWHLVLPLVQGALNHQPANRLGGVAPVTAFTGLPAKTPMSGFSNIEALAAALHDLHRDVSTRSDKLRQQARGRHDKKNKVKFTNFAVGDYLLWRGPNQVVRVVTDHVMETQQLVPPFGVSTHHSCGLNMYQDSSLEVTEDLINQIALGDGRFHVERLEKVRLAVGEYQVQVKWMGLGDEEVSWELVRELLDDIPVVFTKRCKTHKSAKYVAAMVKNLGLL